MTDPYYERSFVVCFVFPGRHVLRNVARLFFAVILLICGPAQAGAAPVQTPHVNAELVAEYDAIRPGEPFWVGLRLLHEPTWHTYWINPGDAGYATSIEWTLPEGFEAGILQFPSPHRFDGNGGLAGYGYTDEVILLTRITPPGNLQPGTEIAIRGKAGWLICDPQQCLPGGADLALTLGVSDAPAPTSFKPNINAFVDRLPHSSIGWRLSFSRSGDTLNLTLHGPHGFGDPLPDLYFFAEPTGLIVPGAPQGFAIDDSSSITGVLPLKPGAELPQKIPGILYSPPGFPNANNVKALRLTASADGAAVAAPGADIPVLDSPLPTPGASSSIGIFAAMGFAFLGGLLLNLMPCVFPVISLKIMSFVNQSGEDHRKIVIHGLVFAVGVVITFWVLSGVLIALRAAGAQLGWGFQLQSPPFVMAMTALLFILALSLFGVFEIGAGLTGVGGRLAGSAGFGGSFWSGALATILATPCAAPFMGPAVGFALAQPPASSLLIFTCLALGMALPYVLLSLYPGLLKFIPKPGAWMETFKQLMGFPMLAVVIWLLWVLGLQIGIHGLALHLGALFLIGLAAWTLGRFGSPVRPRTQRLVARAAALVFLAAAFGFSHQAIAFQAAPSLAHSTKSGVEWQPWSEDAVARALADGNPVFVDFTAAWCLTCQANKIALHADAVETAIAEKSIALLEGDWTHQDPAITQALAKHGRATVPLYLLYDPADPSNPVILPQILTKAILLEAFEGL